MDLADNGLFAALTKPDQALVRRMARPIDLVSGQVLLSPRSTEHATYFLTGASVALMVRNEAHQGLAMGLIGREGAVGVQFAFNEQQGIFTLLVQSAGAAWCLDGDELKTAAENRPQLVLVLARYVWQLAQDVALFSAFAQLNDVKPRLARWLVSSAAAIRSNELKLTQEHLGQMLGVRRASATLAAIELKDQGLLTYRRGRLEILDLPGLEVVANVDRQAPAAVR